MVLAGRTFETLHDLIEGGEIAIIIRLPRAPDMPPSADALPVSRGSELLPVSVRLTLGTLVEMGQGLLHVLARDTHQFLREEKTPGN